MSQAFNMTNYEKEYNDFKWNISEYFNFASDVIDKWAKDPEKLAMLWVDDDGNKQEKTFLDFSISSKKLANVLTASGVKRDDLVIVMLGRDIEWWEIFSACIRMGALISPGTTQLTSKDIEYRIKTAEAVCFITDNANASKFEEIEKNCPTIKSKIIIGEKRDGWIGYNKEMEKASEVFETAKTKATDKSIVYFTSGTTGFPKMVLHSHSYGFAHTTTGKYWLDLKPEDLHWNVSDTGWAKAAWSSYFGPWNMGAALFTHCTDRFDPVKTLELLQEFPVTTMCGAPTIYRMLVLQDLSKFNFPSLRHCVGAGEPLNPEVIEIWKKATNTIIRDGYGQTETVLLCGNFPCIEARFGSMGKPSPGIDLNIIDNDQNIVPVNTEGDIAINIDSERPLGLFQEYWKEPEKTASTEKNGWYLTGDRAYKDEDGYFWFVSRSDDLILSSGYRIGPFEVESALIEHDAVAESAVVSSPDEKRGEIVKAFIVLVDGFDPSDKLKKEIQDHVKKVTAPYKYPRKIDFVKILPKTVSGKIRRIELREAEWKK
ncbi:MAG: acyl-CoA synthetase [Desulfobacteraceae bacterium 4572_130]|nr:MAG: acyl-CoA synthetase [Desulfobacteraceae bacterium 4572_130]